MRRAADARFLRPAGIVSFTLFRYNENIRKKRKLQQESRLGVLWNHTLYILQRLSDWD